MLKALIRTALIIAAIFIAVRFVPALQQYQTIAIILAVVSGLFGFITRTLFVLLLLAAAAIGYFIFF